MAIDKAIDSAALESDLTSVADAIRTKGGTSDTLAFPDGFVSAIGAIEAGGGESGGESEETEKAVRFYDFDGTLLHSYTIEEAQALTELPNGGEHEGLVFSGWNWDLEEIQALTHFADIGAQYGTDDGSTRIKLVIPHANVKIRLVASQSNPYVIDIDWGDGDVNTTKHVNFVYTHIYEAPGEYTLKLSPNTDGEKVRFALSYLAISNANYTNSYSYPTSSENAGFQNLVKEVYFGEHTETVCSAAYQGMKKIQRISASKSVPWTIYNPCGSAICILPKNNTGATVIIDRGNVETIALPATFSGTILTTLEIKYTDVQRVAIPAGMTTSGEYRGCRKLKEVYIPESVTSIEGSAFYDCTGLTSIDIPESVTSIGSYAFYNCTGLTSIDIPENVTSIGSYAFNNCTSLTSINIPENVTSIEGSAFNNCWALRDVVIPESVTSIEGSAFNNCTNLTSINIPENVTSIGSYAFNNCTSLTSINIPENVTSIEGSAFNNCASLTSIDIPESVTSIGSAAFAGGSLLNSITLLGTPSSISSNAFASASAFTINVPWAEGAVANAPWGATNATINYNYTGEA